MKVYLVRHIATEEIQGIFWGSPEQVWDCMDELDDPYDVKVVRIADFQAKSTKKRA